MMGKGQVAAMQTRLKVIAAAEKLITGRGFESVTVDDIGAEAGVAKGTFYTCFRRLCHREPIWYEFYFNRHMGQTRLCIQVRMSRNT